jgi:hypothetical protein
LPETWRGYGGIFIGGTCSDSMSEANRRRDVVIDKVLANMMSAIVNLSAVPVGNEISISPPHKDHVDVQLKAGPWREVIKKYHVPLDGSEIY